jgi:CubicO group peptidase (beta-lactamase class C family)
MQPSPYLPAAFALLLLAACASTPAPRETQAQRIAEDQRLSTRLDARLQRLARRGFSGAVLVEREGRVLLHAGYGMADREAGRPVSADTVFHIGSLSKSFTAAAVLQLESEGRLRLDDRLDRHFAEVPADKAAISLRQLLTHSAGLPDRVLPCSRAEAGALDRDAYVRTVLAAPLLDRPGRRYRYSNAGYDLLGAVIELASGQAYEDYLRRALLDPAGLHDTGIAPATWAEPERIALGYRADGRPWGTLHSLFWGEHGALWCNLASGALLSTVDDLRRWQRALLEGRVLAPEQVERMWSPQIAEQPGRRSHYGFGFLISEHPGLGRLVAHNGSLSRVLEAELRWYRDRDLLLVLAGNSAALTATAAMPELVRQLPGAVQSPRPGAWR